MWLRIQTYKDLIWKWTEIESVNEYLYVWVKIKETFWVQLQRGVKNSSKICYTSELKCENENNHRSNWLCVFFFVGFNRTCVPFGNAETRIFSLSRRTVRGKGFSHFPIFPPKQTDEIAFASNRSRSRRLTRICNLSQNKISHTQYFNSNAGVTFWTFQVCHTVLKWFIERVEARRRVQIINKLSDASEAVAWLMEEISPDDFSNTIALNTATNYVLYEAFIYIYYMAKRYITNHIGE